MASAINSNKGFIAAVTRLTGKPVRKAKHGLRFRVVVTSRDGKECAVNLGPLKENRDRPSSATLRETADRLHVKRDQLAEVLDEWSPEQLREHLQKLSEEELKPPAHLHRRRTAS